MPATEPPPIRSIAIVGVGLLGGSVAKTLRRIDSTVHTVGYARDAAAADRLRRYAWLSDVQTDLTAVCQNIDVVVIATPVDQIADLARRCHDASGPTTLITDVGSTKAAIADQTADLPRFIAAHPIAGSEQSGAAAATDDLFTGKTTILTPAQNADAAMTDRAESFWRHLGTTILTLTPAQHDRHLAAVSHMPHLIAAIVARQTPPAAGPIVGSGWRDITRVAAGDVAMWSAIVAANRSAITASLRSAADDLQQLIDNLDNPAAVESFLSTARAIRNDPAFQDEPNAEPNANPTNRQTP